MPFFTPKCPVDSDTKDSIERAFEWLLKEFGSDEFRSTGIVLPDDKAFPSHISADERTIRAFLEAVCGYMDVPYESVVLEVFEDVPGDAIHPLASTEDGSEKACGLYRWYAGRHEIAIDRSLLRSPVTLVATIAHELAHARLRSDLVIDDDRENEELLTDYASIFFGMGIFTANSIVRFDQFTTGVSQGWRASRQGYIDEESAGYALGLYSYLKGEHDPAWPKFLETGPRYFFKKTLRYLVKTGDCSIEIAN